ncbi:MAG TPA: TetR family transcriptional regulator, partial [Ilumatobacteraceae bacterium]|nr:TetR family transcriptional regulator [Ilumatobacteraceae bacterium]
GMTVEAATEDDAQPARVQVDGRRGRRDRNRDAVVDALLTLYHDGVLEPSADAIAEQAGLSARSLFRYFDDLDDLQRAAVERHAA